LIFKDIFQLYEIGKELGLSRKEINSTLLFKNQYPLILALMIIIILMFFAFIFWDIALLLYMRTTEPVYTEGTFYSSVSLKEFKDKKWS